MDIDLFKSTHSYMHRMHTPRLFVILLSNCMDYIKNIRRHKFQTILLYLYIIELDIYINIIINLYRR